MTIEDFTYREVAKEWARISAQEAARGRFEASKHAENITRKYDLLSVCCGDEEDIAYWERVIDEYKVAFRAAGGGVLQ